MFIVCPPSITMFFFSLSLWLLLSSVDSFVLIVVLMFMRERKYKKTLSKKWVALERSTSKWFYLLRMYLSVFMSTWYFFCIFYSYFVWCLLFSCVAFFSTSVSLLTYILLRWYDFHSEQVCKFEYVCVCTFCNMNLSHIIISQGKWPTNQLAWLPRGSIVHKLFLVSHIVTEKERLHNCWCDTTPKYFSLSFFLTQPD